MGQDGRDFPEMTPKAAAAFAAYVGLGPKRSLDALCKRYRSATEPPPTKRLDTLKEWSVKYGWQSLIASAATALADIRLEQAAEIDAASFLRTSELIAERLEYVTYHHLDAIIDMRSAVRKPQPKQTTVNVNVTIREKAEAIAAQLGVPVAHVIEQAQAIAAAEWDRLEANAWSLKQ